MKKEKESKEKESKGERNKEKGRGKSILRGKGDAKTSYSQRALERFLMTMWAERRKSEKAIRGPIGDRGPITVRCQSISSGRRKLLVHATCLRVRLNAARVRSEMTFVLQISCPLFLFLLVLLLRFHFSAYFDYFCFSSSLCRALFVSSFFFIFSLFSSSVSLARSLQ